MEIGGQGCWQSGSQRRRAWVKWWLVLKGASGVAVSGEGIGWRGSQWKRVHMDGWSVNKGVGGVVLSAEERN